jgi:alkylation response protein AidB-like acyl-CoA dehydrogenase
MDYFLTDDQREIRKLARRITEEKILPVRAELDETETFPWEVMRACADTGLFGVSIPEPTVAWVAAPSKTALSSRS